MDMREKIARAMFGTSASLASWEELLPEIQGFWLDLADAALSAMEEPTEAMVDAGTRAYDEGDGEYGIFCAMIRKAKER